MNLKPIKQNQTELKLNNYVVFFSYQTPVVAWDRRTGQVYVTEKKWSRTTTRHIKAYLATINPHTPDNYQVVSQEYLDNLLNEVK